MSHPELVGLVLAGGHSLRMGRDKAALVVDGMPLLERTVNLLRPLCERVMVSVRDDQTTDPLRSRYDLLLDPPGDHGPIGAIFQVLESYPRHGALVVACDMPYLDNDTLGRLIRRRDPAMEATAYRAGDGDPHPLCAIWEPGCRALLAVAMATGDHSPRRFLQSADVVLVEPTDPRQLISANTIDELPD